MIRHIAVLTGKRGGYGAMKPMLRAIDNDPSLRLSLIVTDQHVSQKFGATIAEVQQDFQVAAAVDMEQVDGSPRARSRALGVCLTRISEVLADLAPDLLILYGDRGEVLATAIAAVTLRIPIAHLQGGDVSGNVDEVMRHAVTKLSHLHFPSTDTSAKRILDMGEEPWRVEVVGDNHVDTIVAGGYTLAEPLRTRYDIPVGQAPIVVLLHPETTRVRDGYTDMRAVLDAVLAEGRRTFIVYPCSDHGYEDIVRAIGEYAGMPGVSAHKNIDAPDFWGLLNIAAVMVGNSSAGLIETPYFHLPAINIGDRQMGREHSNNVIHCGFEPADLRAALNRALRAPEFLTMAANCEQPFGDGYAWRRIVARLKTVELGFALLDKRLVNV
jgi:GDP/UDP-N,N'-diacetylbacillosamine 2-epimerase (hydrolysing)